MNAPIIFATNNKHKLEEIRAAVGPSLRIVSLREAGIVIDIPEPHETLEANAREKADAIHRLTGNDVFSEDSGLEVPALNGQPGVRSARYAGDSRSDRENIDLLLQRLGDSADRGARFRTVIALIWRGTYHQFDGACEGRILSGPIGQSGFGYDPVFAPAGETRSFAQLSLEEKNRYSHRRKAADLLLAFLRENK